MKAKNLLEITGTSYNVDLDIVYSTKNNFVGTPVYSKAKLFLHKEAAKKLLIASSIANELGFKIKVYDGFRPFEVQSFFFNFLKDERYVSDPKYGLATHTRGVAIDCSLVDLKTNQELDFGTGFDDMTEKSHHNARDITKNQSLNRTILAGIMSKSGFVSLETEWWHFHLASFLLDQSNYPKITDEESGLGLSSDLVLKSFKN